MIKKLKCSTISKTESIVLSRLLGYWRIIYIDVLQHVPLRAVYLGESLTRKLPVCDRSCFFFDKSYFASSFTVSIYKYNASVYDHILF